MLALAVLLLVTSVALNAAPLTLHVSTNGNDSWSGKFAEPQPGGSDGPVRTAQAALRLVRESRANPDTPAVILFRSGRHELAEPITLTPELSNVTLAAQPGEKPVLSGGRRVSGWKQVSEKSGFWQAEVPAPRSGEWYFRQLFVNGERQQRARTPNSGFYRIQGSSPRDTPVRIPFKPGEIKKAWADDGDVELIALLAWADLRMQIRSVDEANNIATLSGTPRPSNKENNAQYYIENAPDALDQPGEWYLDRRTGLVTWFAPAGIDPNEAEVIAPRLEELLVIRGDVANAAPVRNVTIRGLTFSHTDWTLGPNGYADTQAAIATRGDLLAEGAVDCSIENCTLTALAGYAIEMGRGCQRFRVVGNEMSDLGAGGIRVGDTNKAPKPAEENHSHIITDNRIHHGGLIYPPAVGVFILQSGTNRIAHNHIHHLFYTAISVGWNWGYQETPCRENIVEFNHLHDIGQGRLSDMGGVYTLGIQRGTIIRHNLIHDVSAFTYGGWGLYTDEGSTGILLENNVVYRCKNAGFHQHYGRENVIRNNVFAFNLENQLMRTRPEPHISFYFTNNIVVFDSGNLLGSNWSNDNYVMDHNLFWDTRTGSAENMKFAGATLEQWRARGHDRNSVIGDPLFVQPRTADLKLQPNSPAFKLGFKPIDLSRVGPR